MKKLVLLHDVSPKDSIDDIVDMVMETIHGDGPWPDDDVEDNNEVAEHSPGGESRDVRSK